MAHKSWYDYIKGRKTKCITNAFWWIKFQIKFRTMVNRSVCQINEFFLSSVYRQAQIEFGFADCITSGFFFSFFSLLGRLKRWAHAIHVKFEKRGFFVFWNLKFESRNMVSQNMGVFYTQFFHHDFDEDRSRNRYIHSHEVFQSAPPVSHSTSAHPTLKTFNQ